MTNPIQIWTCAAHHAAFRCGGWASLRLSSGFLTGVAGGERNTTGARMELAGLAAALQDLPPIASGSPAAPVRIHTASPELAAFARLLANAERASGNMTSAGRPDAPEENLDLWARILGAAKGRHLDMVQLAVRPDTPMAFAAAWADLAKDKAKTSGPFTAAIPRPNLAKVQGLGPF